jgi:hypothetical protein
MIRLIAAAGFALVVAETFELSPLASATSKRSSCWNKSALPWNPVSQCNSLGWHARARQVRG